MSLNERLEFLLNVNAEGAIKGFKNVGDEAEKHLGRAQKGIDKTGQMMTKMGSAAVVGAGLIGVGLFELTKKWEEGALAAGKMSVATGLTVQQASRWSDVARDADTDTGVLTASLGKMDKAVQNSPAAFDKLGASIVRTKSGGIDTQATFLSVVDALNAAGGAANNAGDATAILGKGWQGMSELIGKSSGELKDKLAAVNAQQVFNEDDVSEAEHLRDTMNEVKDNAESLALSLGKSAAPVVADVTQVLGGMTRGLLAVDSATGGMLGKFASIAALGVGAAGALSVIGGQAIKARDKLMPVGEDGARSLSGLGVAAIGVGVGVAAFGIITEIMGQHAKQAKANVEDLSKRVEQLGLTTDEAAKQKITEFIAKNDGMAEAMNNAGLSSADLQAAVVGGDAAVSAFNKKLEAANQTLSGYGTMMPTTQAWHLTEAVSAQATAFQTLTDQTKVTADATASLGETQADQVASQKAMVDEQLAQNKELVDSEKGIVAAQQDRLKVQDDLINQGRAAVDAQWAYVQAQQATKEALAEANKTLADGKSSEDDKTDAVIAGTNAALDQAKAYVDMKGDQDNAKAANDDMITSLYGTATALAPDNPIRKSILDYVASLQSIPTDVTTTITTAFVDTGAPGTHHDSFAPATTTSTNHPGPLKSFDVGGTVPGPIGAPMVAVVHGGEEVIPNGKHAGVSVTNHFHGITNIHELVSQQSRQLAFDLRSGKY